MRQEVYDALLREVQAKLEDRTETTPESLVDDQMGPEITFSLKTYNVPGGLATDLFESKHATYNIKGPMGHGLAAKRSGTNVAFCAGTGVFVYLDLVTHVARKMMGTLSPSEQGMVNDDFKFVLFVSF